MDHRTSLTFCFYGHRILLANSSDQDVNFRLALQFLDYPLLLLRAYGQSDGNTGVLPIGEGKSCQLSSEDSLEALQLIEQVRHTPQPTKGGMQCNLCRHMTTAAAGQTCAAAAG
jgi:hypothetical protein